MSAVRKRSVSIRGHRTSFSIEDEFFAALVGIADRRGSSVAALIAETDAARSRQTNLSSALRLLVLRSLSERSDH